MFGQLESSSRKQSYSYLECPTDGEETAMLPLDIEQGEVVHPIPVWKRYYMVCLFTLTATLLYADQNLLAPNLSAAARYFNFNEVEKDAKLGGYMMACFFLVGAPSALLVGWLTDRWDRRWLLFLVMLLGETPSLATYWVTQYWHFLILRTLTGISVGGSFPLVFSLLGDLFPTTERAIVTGVVQIATGLGIGLGQGLAGTLGPATNWRLPFVVVAVPALLLSIMMVMTTEDPPRGGFEACLGHLQAQGAQYQENVTWEKVKVLLGVPSNLLIILQGLPGSLPWGMLLTYFADYLSLNKHLSIRQATLLVVLFGIAGGPGVVVGGGMGQWLYNLKKEYMVVFGGIGALIGMGPLLFLVNADLAQTSYPLAAWVAVLGGFFAGFPGPILRAAMLNVNEPEVRGVAIALQSVTDDIGKGAAPFLVAWFIIGLGRQTAFNLATLGWVPCGISLFLVACYLRQDEAHMQKRLMTKVNSVGALTPIQYEEEEGEGEGGLMKDVRRVGL